MHNCAPETLGVLDLEVRLGCGLLGIFSIGDECSPASGPAGSVTPASDKRQWACSGCCLNEWPLGLAMTCMPLYVAYIHIYVCICIVLASWIAQSRASSDVGLPGHGSVGPEWPVGRCSVALLHSARLTVCRRCVLPAVWQRHSSRAGRSTCRPWTSGSHLTLARTAFR
jgi:hypothetical protein